jgi:hypothetical protein
MKVKLWLIAAVLGVLAHTRLSALDLWRYPEAADKHALFFDVKFASLSFSEGFILSYPEFSLDYLLPFRFPLSLGVYFKTPDPNLKSFGARAAYHIDIRDPNTDLYFLYVFDLGFLRNDLLEEYGDEKQQLRLYDFRVGVRRLFGKFFCLTLETDYHFSGINIGVSIKLN